ncbi:hypothetical protein [uncultured Roseobacter sp.]|uniref:hypothetical protein n=1 Tax=uncultured Roseobacter sp. TaxID=114847 RepID=UPI00261480F8|nr:hypothetical protein [uncultured Roseobacter sp.]
MTETDSQKLRVYLGPLATSLVAEVPSNARGPMLDAELEKLNEAATVSNRLAELADVVQKTNSTSSANAAALVRIGQSIAEAASLQREAVDRLHELSSVMRGIYALMKLRFDSLDKQHHTTRGLIARTFFEGEDAEPIFAEMDKMFERVTRTTNELEHDQLKVLARIDAELQRIISQPVVPTERTGPAEDLQPDMIQMMDREQEL